MIYQINFESHNVVLRRSVGWFRDNDVIRCRVHNQRNAWNDVRFQRHAGVVIRRVIQQEVCLKQHSANVLNVPHNRTS
jgi:hypothetical protein